MQGRTGQGGAIGLSSAASESDRGKRKRMLQVSYQSENEGLAHFMVVGLT